MQSLWEESGHCPQHMTAATRHPSPVTRTLSQGDAVWYGCISSRRSGPPGGIGLLAIEAAALQDVRAISLDLDQPATDAAAANAAAAARAGALRGTVEVRSLAALHLLTQYGYLHTTDKTFGVLRSYGLN